MGINHVVLEVGDLEAALDFYGRGSISSSAAASAAWPSSTWATSSSCSPRAARRRRTSSATSAWWWTIASGAGRLRETDAEILSGRGLDFRDPWGNHVQVVEYADVQFSKTAAVLRGMGLEGLAKSPEA